MQSVRAPIMPFRVNTVSNENNSFLRRRTDNCSENVTRNDCLFSSHLLSQLLWTPFDTSSEGSIKSCHPWVTVSGSNQVMWPKTWVGSIFTNDFLIFPLFLVLSSSSFSKELFEIGTITTTFIPLSSLHFIVRCPESIPFRKKGVKISTVGKWAERRTRNTNPCFLSVFTRGEREKQTIRRIENWWWILISALDPYPIQNKYFNYFFFVLDVIQ